MLKTTNKQFNKELKAETFAVSKKWKIKLRLHVVVQVSKLMALHTSKTGLKYITGIWNEMESRRIIMFWKTYDL